MTDPIIARLIARLRARSAAGIAEYGTTLARTDLSRLDWLRHLRDELLDAAGYAERLIEEEASAPPGPREEPWREAARGHQRGEHALGCPRDCPWRGR